MGAVRLKQGQWCVTRRLERHRAVYPDLDFEEHRSHQLSQWRVHAAALESLAELEAERVNRLRCPPVC